MSKNAMIFYQFSRELVERGDFTPFLKRFGREKLPEGKRLARMQGAISFLVEGYDNDPRELYEIPEVRTFYSRFFDQWPYWLFFCALHNEGLAMMVACRTSNLQSFKRPGEATVGLNLSVGDMVQFLSEAFPPMNMMFERAKLPDARIAEQTRAVFDYFQLPVGLMPGQR